MKKLTKKLGMSTLALASVFTVGMLSVKTSSVSVNADQYAANTSYTYQAASATNAQKGTYVLTPFETSYSYEVTTTGTGASATSSLEFKFEFNINNADAPALTYFNGAASLSDLRAEYAITLEGGTTDYEDEAFITSATNWTSVESSLASTADTENLSTNTYKITFDSSKTTDASMTSVRAALSDLEAGQTYTMRIYLGNSASDATPTRYAQTTLNSSLDLDAELLDRSTQILEFTFTTPETAGSYSVGQTNTGSGTWTGTAVSQTSNAYSNNVTAAGDNSLKKYTANDRNLVVSETSLEGNFSIDLSTDSTPDDADSSNAVINFTAIIPNALVSQGEINYGFSMSNNDVLVDADPTNDEDLVYNAIALDSINGTDYSNTINVSTVEGYNVWQYSTNNDAGVAATLDSMEADTNYTFRVHISDTALTQENLEAPTNRAPSVVIEFTFWTPQTSTGNTVWTGGIVNNTTEEFTTTAITAIVLASIFGVTTIGLGAYIVVNNNKSKKASTPATK